MKLISSPQALVGGLALFLSQLIPGGGEVLGLALNRVLAGLGGGFVGWAFDPDGGQENGGPLTKPLVRVGVGAALGNYMPWAANLVPGVTVPEGTPDAGLAFVVAVFSVFIIQLIRSQIKS